MSFVTHLDASAESNRRTAERRLVKSVFAAWSARGAPFTVIVHDISETGFRAEFSSELQVGDEVKLRLGGAGYVPAQVVWRDGWDHGCRFLTPILPEEVREALDTLTPVVEPVDAAAPTPAVEGQGWFGRSRHKSRRLAILIVALLLIGEAYLIGRMLI